MIRLAKPKLAAYWKDHLIVLDGKTDDVFPNPSLKTVVSLRRFFRFDRPMYKCESCKEKVSAGKKIRDSCTAITSDFMICNNCYKKGDLKLAKCKNNRCKKLGIKIGSNVICPDAHTIKWKLFSSNNEKDMRSVSNYLENKNVPLSTLNPDLATKIGRTVPSNVSQDKLLPYLNSGLSENFARAIVYAEENNGDVGSILDLWEADWWKQYPPTDILVQAILELRLSEKDGKYIHSIRSDYPNLAKCCIEQTVTMSWTRSLLKSGFEGYPEAVDDILLGGNPMIIARIRGINLDTKTSPPKLKKAVISGKK